MATALAQTPIFDISSPPRVIRGGKNEPSFAPPPYPTVSSADAAAACVDPGNGITAGPAQDCGAPTGAGQTVHPTVRTPDGGAYPGVLLDDILEYRALRAHMLAGRRLDTAAHGRYVELEQLLRANERPSADRSHLRAFHRYEIECMRGRLRHRVGRQTMLAPVTVENISAGGVKLIMDQPPQIGEQVWLQLDNAVLPSRVVWSSGFAVGLMFAGAPKWG